MIDLVLVHVIQASKDPGYDFDNLVVGEFGVLVYVFFDQIKEGFLDVGEYHIGTGVVHKLIVDTDDVGVNEFGVDCVFADSLVEHFAVMEPEVFDDVFDTVNLGLVESVVDAMSVFEILFVFIHLVYMYIITRRF